MQSKMPARLGRQAMLALALEAGAKYLKERDPNLGQRVRLLSERNGVLHALASSGPAAAELKNAKKGLFSAMEAASGLKFIDLKISLRGTLVNEEQF